MNERYPNHTSTTNSINKSLKNSKSNLTENSRLEKPILASADYDSPSPSPTKLSMPLNDSSISQKSPLKIEKQRGLTLTTIQSVSSAQPISKSRELLIQISADSPTTQKSKLSGGIQKSLEQLTLHSKSKVKSISNNELLECLISTKNFTEPNTLNEKLLTVPIDLRSISAFNILHIKNSLNINIMPLLIRRLREKVLQDFHLEKHLTSKDSRDAIEHYREQYKSDLIKKVRVVVYDNEMPENTSDTEAWAFVEIIYSGILCNFLEGRLQENPLQRETKPVEVVYLKNGFSSFTSLPNSFEFLERKQDNFGSPMTIVSNNFSLVTDNELSTENISVQPPSNGNSQLNLNSSLNYSNSRFASISATNSPLPKTENVFSNSLKLSGNGNHNALTINSGSGGSEHSLAKKKRSLSILTTPPSPSPLTLKNNKIFNSKNSISENCGLNVGDTPKKGSYSLNLDSSLNTSSKLSIGENSNTFLSDYNSSPPMSAVFSAYTLIRPYLYLGSDVIPSSSNAIEELKDLKITHILNVAHDVILNPALEENFGFLWIPLKDNLEQEIYDDLKKACAFIDAAREKSQDSVIFVHCKAGKSRSATVVVAYLIWCEAMKQADAYEQVKQLRPEVCPNLSFVMELNRLALEKHGIQS
ncbi:hypothetical protein HDU92_008369 [Lobulomyces angularis]|nr:hypothetical protein HDU92_008369 [Lobulomyces angularis]